MLQPNRAALAALLTSVVPLVLLKTEEAPSQQDTRPAAEVQVAKKANPDDVESIDAIVASLYDVISGDKGEARDWDRFRSLFHPELGRLMPLRAKDDRWQATGMEPNDYAEQAKRWSSSQAFYEREIARRTESFGGLCHVWSTYAGFDASDAKEPFVRGINSIQLMNDGERWWVLSLSWDAERPDQELPERYLGK